MLWTLGPKHPTLFAGRAGKTIAKALRRPGFNLVAGPGNFLVSSTNQLQPEDETRARQWGAALAARIRPANQRSSRWSTVQSRLSKGLTWPPTQLHRLHPFPRRRHA